MEKSIPTTRGTHPTKKKVINCGQATKDGWIGEGEARIVLLAFVAADEQLIPARV